MYVDSGGAKRLEMMNEGGAAPYPRCWAPWAEPQHLHQVSHRVSAVAVCVRRSCVTCRSHSGVCGGVCGGVCAAVMCNVQVS